MFLFLPFPMAKARADQSDREGERQRREEPKRKKRLFRTFFSFSPGGGEAENFPGPLLTLFRGRSGSVEVVAGRRRGNALYEGERRIK